jgi:hypothetical protein
VLVAIVYSWAALVGKIVPQLYIWICSSSYGTASDTSHGTHSLHPLNESTWSNGKLRNEAGTSAALLVAKSIPLSQSTAVSRILLSWATINLHSLLQKAVGVRGVYHSTSMAEGSFERANGKIFRKNTKTKKTPWPESASETYRQTDRRLSAMLVSTFTDRGYRVVSTTDPHDRILGFIDRNRYFLFQVAPQ